MNNTEKLKLLENQFGVPFLEDICQRYVGWETWETYTNKEKRAVYEKLNALSKNEIIQLWGDWNGIGDRTRIILKMVEFI